MLNSKIGVTSSDFITIRNNRLRPIVVKKTLKNVLFTSQNAVEALLSNFSPMELDFENIYCVGRRTKRLIEKRIGKVVHIENSAEKLTNYLVSNLKDDGVTFFCGNKRRDDLPTKLVENNIKVNEVECYQTQLTPRKIEEKYKFIELDSHKRPVIMEYISFKFENGKWVFGRYPMHYIHKETEIGKVKTLHNNV